MAIVKPPCTLVKTIDLGNLSVVSGFVYDPVTRQMIAIDGDLLTADILSGTSLVKQVSLPNQCPATAAWSPQLKAVLISDYCGGAYTTGGIDLMYITNVEGKTKVATVLDAFDHTQDNNPDNVLVADGYIFASGNQVDVFNERTLHYLGSYPTIGGNPTSLIWDPSNNTVVLGMVCAYDCLASQEVFFLNVSSISTRTFTFHNLVVKDILEGGVGGLAYSTSSGKVYISAASGSDVWIVNHTGVLSHIYVNQHGHSYPGLGSMAYDPEDHFVYLCGDALYVLT